MANSTGQFLSRRPCSSYTVAWLCALVEIECAAAVKMLDHWHRPAVIPDDEDQNSYRFGDLGGHNVVIASMPANKPGKVSAYKLVHPLHRSFRNLKICLFVGIGGGVPRNPQPEDPLDDVRLGDVVIGWPEETGAPAVVQYDLCKRVNSDSSTSLGTLNNPNDKLLKGLNEILLRRAMNEKSDFASHLKKLEGLPKFARPDDSTDVLYDNDYTHREEGRLCDSCDSCDSSRLVERRRRDTDELVFHRSTILSGDTFQMDGKHRDKLSHDYYNAKCFEMEAAGVAGDIQCLMIRGIADYADTHANRLWQHYAAARAAAFACEYLKCMRPSAMSSLPSGISDRDSAASQSFSYSGSSIQSRDDSYHPRLLQGTEQYELGHLAEGAESSGTASERANVDIGSLISSGKLMHKQYEESEEIEAAHALANALSYYRQAQTALVNTRNVDPHLWTQVWLGLLESEMRLTFKISSLEEKEWHMEQAENSGDEALRAAKKTLKSGMEALVRLVLAYATGRRVQLQKLRHGSDERETGLRKEAAVRGIRAALTDLKSADQGQYEDERKCAQWWIKHVSKVG